MGDDPLAEGADLLTVVLAFADVENHAVVLRLDPLGDLLFVDALDEKIGIRCAARRQDLSPHIDQGLDDRILLALVFGLDVEGLALVLDVRVETRDL